MDLIQAIKKGKTGGVVIVDDSYSLPAGIATQETLSEVSHIISIRAECHEALADALGLLDERAHGDVMQAVERGASALWPLYQSGGLVQEALEPIFADSKLKAEGHSEALSAIERFCKKKLRIVPQTFATLEDAKTALSGCSIAFVDFRLRDGATNSASIQSHGKFADQYKAKPLVDGIETPKLIYLISSSLPDRSELKTFRDATGIRMAFFGALRKSDIDENLLLSEVNKWKYKYPQSIKLDSYINVVSTTIKDAAAALASQLDAIELHELGMLNAFRLDVEGESLQEYLSWLVSEALASRIRSAPPMQEKLLPREGEIPLDGKAEIGTALFELFSQIAVSPVSSSTKAPRFGDIYRIMPKAREVKENSPAAVGGQKKVLLVISPACDLQRAGPEDSVLCVSGSETTPKSSAFELTQQGSTLFGESVHLAKYMDGAKARYTKLSWDKKRLVTLSVKELMSTAKYKKVARLSEMFAQEAKEQALSTASRVGLPVHPSFVASTEVFIRMKFGDAQHHHDLSASADFTCAAVLRGRRKDSTSKDTQSFIAFTEQFADWMRREFIPAAKLKFTSTVNTKFLNVERFFADWKPGYQVELGGSNKKVLAGGVLSFSLVDQIDTGDAANNIFDIQVRAS